MAAELRRKREGDCNAYQSDDEAREAFRSRSEPNDIRPEPYTLPEWFRG